MSTTTLRAAPLASPLLHADRLFPADLATRAIARRLYDEVARPADHLAARPHRPALVCRERAVPRSGAAARRARPLRLPHALQPGRAAGGARRRRAATARRSRPTRARSGGASPSTIICSAARRRGCGSTTCSRRCSASTSGSRPETADHYLRPHRRVPGEAGVPAARAVRALQHRGDRHHREPARRPGCARGDRARPAGRAAWSPPTGPTRWSIPEFDGFRANLAALRRADRLRHATSGAAISRRTAQRRAYFKQHRRDLDRPRPSDGAHRRPAAGRGRGAVRARSCAGESRAGEAELFRAQMLTEMARMSLDDGLVMQIHPGSLAQPQSAAASRASAATRAPTSRRRTDYVRALKPLLDRFGNERDLTHHPLHARRDHLFARARAAGRALSGAAARARLVVLRQARGHAALPRADDRDGRLLQHRRLQRRHPRLPVDPGAPRRGAPRRLRLSRRAGRHHRLDEDEAREVAHDLAYRLAKKAYKL